MSEVNGPGTGRDERVYTHPVLGDLPAIPTARITVDGLEIEAREGEVIAAALLAHGIRVFRTSARSGESRGMFCAVGRCPDCMMTVDGVPNVQTCVTSVRDGMQIRSQSGLGRWNGKP